MNSEIEVKFFPTDKDWVRERLRSVGASLHAQDTLMRRVVYHQRRNPQIAATYLRIRDEGSCVRLSLKISGTEGGSIEDQKELDVKVESFEQTRELLRIAGFIETGYQENYRETWHIEDTEVAIDTWPDLPAYIEIEGATESAVKKVADLLNMNWETRLFVSTDSLYARVYGLTSESALDLMKVCTFQQSAFAEMTPVSA